LRRGARLGIRYVKGEGGDRRRIAAFHPYPSRLVNRLKTIGHGVYSLLNKNCQALQEDRRGEEEALLPARRPRG